MPVSSAAASVVVTFIMCWSPTLMWRFCFCPVFSWLSSLFANEQHWHMFVLMSQGQATGQAPLLYPLCWSSKELPTYPHSVSPQIAIPSATGDCSSTNTPQGHRLLNSDSVRSYPRMKLTVDGSTGDIGILLPRKLNSKNPDSGSQTGSKAPADPSRVDHSEGESPIQPNKAAQVRDAGASANNAR